MSPRHLSPVGSSSEAAEALGKKLLTRSKFQQSTPRYHGGERRRCFSLFCGGLEQPENNVCEAFIRTNI